MNIEKQLAVTRVSFESGLMTLVFAKPTQSLCLVIDKTNAKSLKIPWTAEVEGAIFAVTINLEHLKKKAGKFDLVVCFANSVEEVAWRPDTPSCLGQIGILHSREVALASEGAISDRTPYICYRLGISEDEYKSLRSLGYDRNVVFSIKLSLIG